MHCNFGASDKPQPSWCAVGESTIYFTPCSRDGDAEPLAITGGRVCNSLTGRKQGVKLRRRIVACQLSGTPAESYGFAGTAAESALSTKVYRLECHFLHGPYCEPVISGLVSQQTGLRIKVS